MTNAILLTAALGWGFSLLIQRGRLTWPPLALLSSLSTLAGCLALVGPLILARSGGKEGSLGELVWLTGGLLVWLFDIAAALQGSGAGPELGNAPGRPHDGPGHAGCLAGRLEMWSGGSRLVLDQRHGLGPGSLLDRPWPSGRGCSRLLRVSRAGLALILDGS